jgi:hypothetical protein
MQFSEYLIARSFVAASEALSGAADKSVQQVSNIATRRLNSTIRSAVPQAAQSSIMAFRYVHVPFKSNNPSS